jgi:hypothetical protein
MSQIKNASAVRLRLSFLLDFQIFVRDVLAGRVRDTADKKDAGYEARA